MNSGNFYMEFHVNHQPGVHKPAVVSPHFINYLWKTSICPSPKDLPLLDNWNWNGFSYLRNCVRFLGEATAHVRSIITSTFQTYEIKVVPQYSSNKGRKLPIATSVYVYYYVCRRIEVRAAIIPVGNRQSSIVTHQIFYNECMRQWWSCMAVAGHNLNFVPIDSSHGNFFQRTKVKKIVNCTNANLTLQFRHPSTVLYSCIQISQRSWWG